MRMKDFEDYLDKMGYGWNDFDRPYEMQNLIEQYADEKAKQALSIANVSNNEVACCGNCHLPLDNIEYVPKAQIADKKHNA